MKKISRFENRESKWIESHSFLVHDAAGGYMMMMMFLFRSAYLLARFDDDDFFIFHLLFVIRNNTHHVTSHLFCQKSERSNRTKEDGTFGDLSTMVVLCVLTQ